MIYQKRKQVIAEEWLFNKHGEERLLRITKNPKLNSLNEIEFVICSAVDITEEYISKQQKEQQENILYSTMDFTQELLTNNHLDEALANGIEMLGNATKVDRVYYWENHYDEITQRWLTSQCMEWCADNIESQIHNPRLQSVPFEESRDFIGILAQNQVFNSHIKDMTSEANMTKDSLSSQGILSILAIPVFLRDEFKGFIGFDSCRVEKEWTEIEVSLLRSFALIYERALEKNQLEQEVLQVKDNFFNFFNMTEDLFVVLTLDGKILDVNNNVVERLNYTREELLGESYTLFHPKEEIEEIRENFDNLLAEKERYFNVSAITKEGEVFPIETSNSKGIWNGENVIFAVVKDVTELTLSEDKFSKIFNNSGVSMFISRFSDGHLLEVNETFLNYLGYIEEEVIGKTSLDLRMTRNYEDRKKFIEQIEVHGKIRDKAIEFTGKDNQVRTGLTNIVPITINGEECLLSSIIDISERIKNEQKILELSNRDELTNLYNRRFIYESVEEIIKDYKENNELFSVAILDLDDFKHVNDQYGHQVGDCVLIKFSKIIEENLREYDVLGRYGGEEFIVLLNHSDLEEGRRVLNRILKLVRETRFICDGYDISLTFSAGITSCEELEKGKITIDQLIRISDQRMYTAKENGKDQIVYK